jgi:hypothetical protein
VTESLSLNHAFLLYLWEIASEFVETWGVAFRLLERTGTFYGILRLLISQLWNTEGYVLSKAFPYTFASLFIARNSNLSLHKGQDFWDDKL